MRDISNIVIGTGSYENVKGGNTVSITGDGGNAWNYYGNAYKKLAPRLKTYLEYATAYKELEKLKDIDLEEYEKYRNIIEDKYIESYYNSRLRDLCVYDLLNILESRFGNNIILLCHEDPTEFCHRRLVADYIELETGLYIPEISVNEEGYVKKIQPIRYKNRLKKVCNNYDCE